MAQCRTPRKAVGLPALPLGRNKGSRLAPALLQATQLLLGGLRLLDLCFCTRTKVVGGSSGPWEAVVGTHHSVQHKLSPCSQQQQQQQRRRHTTFETMQPSRMALPTPAAGTTATRSGTPGTARAQTAVQAEGEQHDPHFVLGVSVDKVHSSLMLGRLGLNPSQVQHPPLQAKVTWASF